MESMGRPTGHRSRIINPWTLRQSPHLYPEPFMTGLGEAASVLPVRTTQMTADKTCNYGKVDNGTCQQMLQFKVLA
jgi:hypothetical protein